MLVDIAQSIKPPKQVRRWVCSVVRLKPFNEQPGPCGYAISTGVKRPARVPGILVEDRELSSFGIRRSELRKLPDRLIKRRSKAVDKITQNQRNFVRGILDLDPNLIPAALAIFLSEKSYGVWIFLKASRLSRRASRWTFALVVFR
jgi:hypothetical protein